VTEHGHPDAPGNDPRTPPAGEGPTQQPAADVPPQQAAADVPPPQPTIPHQTTWLPPQPHEQVPHQQFPHQATGPVFGAPSYAGGLPPAAPAPQPRSGAKRLALAW